MFVRDAEKRGRGDRCAIAVMAKASRPRQTKTRLAPPLTYEQAAELNTAFLFDIVENLALAGEEAEISAYLAFSPSGSASFFEDRFAASVGLIEASLPNFGDCLLLAVQTLLARGFGSAGVLNSDSPTLPTECLIAAARALQRPGNRIVLGPSLDGGYYFLGVKEPHPRLFADIDWSTEHVARQTLERAEELGLETVILPEWYDVDDGDTLRRLAREVLTVVDFRGNMRSYEARRSAEALRGMSLDFGMSEKTRKVPHDSLSIAHSP